MELKAFKGSNIMLVFSVCIVMFIVVLFHSQKVILSDDAIYAYTAKIVKNDTKIAKNNVNNWVKQMQTIRCRESIINLRLQNENLKDVILYDSVEKITTQDIEIVNAYLGQNRYIYIRVEGVNELNDELLEISKLSQECGLEVFELNQAKNKNTTIGLKKNIYRIMLIFLFVFAFITIEIIEKFWFRSRKKEWAIRRCFGVSREELLFETLRTQGVLCFMSFVLSMISLVLWDRYRLELIAMDMIIIGMILVGIVVVKCAVIFTRDFI